MCSPSGHTQAVPKTEYNIHPDLLFCVLLTKLMYEVRCGFKQFAINAKCESRYPVQPQRIVYHLLSWLLWLHDIYIKMHSMRIAYSAHWCASPSSSLQVDGRDAEWQLRYLCITEIAGYVCCAVHALKQSRADPTESFYISSDLSIPAHIVSARICTPSFQNIVHNQQTLTE